MRSTITTCESRRAARARHPRRMRDAARPAVGRRPSLVAGGAMHRSRHRRAGEAGASSPSRIDRGCVRRRQGGEIGKECFSAASGSPGRATNGHLLTNGSLTGRGGARCRLQFLDQLRPDLARARRAASSSRRRRRRTVGPRRRSTTAAGRQTAAARRYADAGGRRSDADDLRAPTVRRRLGADAVSEADGLLSPSTARTRRTSTGTS